MMTAWPTRFRSGLRKKYTASRQRSRLNKSLTGAKANKMSANIVVHTASHRMAVLCPALCDRDTDLSWSHRIQQIAAATPSAVGSSQAKYRAAEAGAVRSMLAGPAQTADVITVLNVHKPRGLTSYGQQKLSKEPKGSTKSRAAAPR
jgi:hypothetical protein